MPGFASRDRLPKGLAVTVAPGVRVHEGVIEVEESALHPHAAKVFKHAVQAAQIYTQAAAEAEQHGALDTNRVPKPGERALASGLKAHGKIYDDAKGKLAGLVTAGKLLKPDQQKALAAHLAENKLSLASATVDLNWGRRWLYVNTK